MMHTQLYYSKMRDIPCLSVELFVMASLQPGGRGKERLRRTMDLRNQQLFLGLPDYLIDDVFHNHNIKTPRQLQKVSIGRRPIWSVPFSLALQHNIDEECQKCVFHNHNIKTPRQ